MGAMRAVTPSTSMMLTMFEPKALPSASPGLPASADSDETTISGAEVPTPMISAPISIFGMWCLMAMATAPSMNISAL